MKRSFETKTNINFTGGFIKKCILRFRVLNCVGEALLLRRVASFKICVLIRFYICGGEVKVKLNGNCLCSPCFYAQFEIKSLESLLLTIVFPNRNLLNRER